MSAIPGPDGKKKLTLAQIYAWISAAWPFYKPGEAGQFCIFFPSIILSHRMFKFLTVYQAG
jgi:hypothetical protein